MDESVETVPKPPEDIFMCPVCLGTFNNPKVLSCGHSFCLDPCLTNVADNPNFLKCPECRVSTQIPSDGLGSLPTNFSLQRAIEGGTVSTLNRTVCSEHRKVFQLRCYTCEKDICFDCLQSVHSSAEHDTDVSRVTDVIEPIRCTLNDFHRMMSEKLAAVVGSAKAEERKRMKTSQSIERSAELAIRSIEDVKDSLLKDLVDISETDTQKFTDEKQRYEALMESADELRERVESLAEAIDRGQLEHLDEREYLEQAVVQLYKKVIPAYERAIPKPTKVVVFIPNNYSANLGKLQVVPRPPPRTPPTASIKEY